MLDTELDHLTHDHHLLLTKVQLVAYVDVFVDNLLGLV